MNRFEKKCFIGSATFHGVLLAVIFLGAAFSSNKAPSDAGPVVTMLPPNLGAPASGNGTPPPAAQPAKPALPEPEPPQPKPETVKQPDPEPPVKVKQPKRVEPKESEEKTGDLPVPVKKPNDNKNREAAKDTPKTNPLVNTKVVRRSNVVDQAAMKMATAAAAAQRERDLRANRIAQANEQARRDAALAEMNDILRGNGTGLGHSRVASPNSIGGGGGDGVASGRYGDGLKAIYDSKWILNADAFDDEASATVRVTVRRDGTVVSSTITKPSGNASFDRSVRAVLNNVTRVPPFTPDMKDTERVFTWRFEKRTRAG